MYWLNRLIIDIVYIFKKNFMYVSLVYLNVFIEIWKIGKCVVYEDVIFVFYLIIIMIVISI